MTYGFDRAFELDISDPKSNFIEIDIIQPIDVERSPRNKKVIIKGNTAYFYERNGKVDTSWSALGLKKSEIKLVSHSIAFAMRQKPFKMCNKIHLIPSHTHLKIPLKSPLIKLTHSQSLTK